VSPSPLGGAIRREAFITSSSGRSRVRSVYARIRNCAARRDEKPRRAESGPREVSARAPTQLPQRVTVATVQTRTQSRFPAGPPRQKARLAARAGRARETGRRGASGPGKVRETSSLGRREKPRRPTANAKATLEVRGQTRSAGPTASQKLAPSPW
jgi:hypothetical protein